MKTLEDVIASVDDVVNTRITRESTPEGLRWRVELTSFTREPQKLRSTTERRIGQGETILEAAEDAAHAEPHRLIYLDAHHVATLP